jgi:hypothetical protein
LREEAAMCLRLVAENPEFRKSVIAVKTCSKAISGLCGKHGKSPCFSEVTFLLLVGPDYSLSILPWVDEEEFLECAF